MLLSPPRGRSSKRNSARLDLLTSTLTEPNKTSANSDTDSPRDSLSPLDDRAKDDFQFNSPNRITIVARSPQNHIGRTWSRGAQSEQERPSTFPECDAKHEVAPAPTSTEACPPRFTLITRDHRPPDLHLTRTNGLTTIQSYDLKQCIKDTQTDSCATITQVARPKPERRLKSPIPMGNKPSSIAGSPVPDNASGHSVVRKPVHILRKSSTNLFKRNDSKSPMPAEITGALIQVSQQASQSTLDSSNGKQDESPVDPFMDTNVPSNPPDESVPVPSAPPVTVTHEHVLRPLSASTTIRQSIIGESHRNSLPDTRSPQTAVKSVSNSPLKQLPPEPYDRHLVLSPSIPAPSPLPEDSPHQYGLRDRADTPVVTEPEEINVVKARRRSSGLDIFNEAKSLQSASSFLNGLSTSRRRAESVQRLSETSAWTFTSYETTRPSSARLPSRPSSTRPSSTSPSTKYSSERCRGHNFKPSGFAYSRPLAMAQMKCYRNHVRLLPSRNKKAPVECAVCHMDDDRDHFSCSWCAIRMCRFCRRDFAERGMAALKERIKQAEIGGSSPSGSSDSLGGAKRGRRSSYM